MNQLNLLNSKAESALQKDCIIYLSNMLTSKPKNSAFNSLDDDTESSNTEPSCQDDDFDSKTRGNFYFEYDCKTKYPFRQTYD